VKITKSWVAAVAGVGLLGLGLAGSPASAEPNGTPQYRALAGVGSDTTENVMNGLSDVITVGGQKVIGSYNANGGGNVTTKDPAVNPACTIARPNGSTAGRTALLTSLQANANAGDGCLDFARSSSSRGSFTSDPNMVWIPFAIDAVSFGVRSDGSVPKSLTLAQVQSIFKCQVASFKPVLPQPGSGTRSYWLGQMGVTEAEITAGTYPCLTGAGTTASRAYSQENDGRALKTDEIMPYSIAQWQSQATAVVTDVRGKTVLGTIDGNAPTVIDSAFGIKRDVFNIVPQSKLATSPTSDVFVGPSSLICQNTATIKKYGFAPNPNCGDTSSVS
jgi:ABC-type phosphate transport system substrate-binding protein